MLDAVPHAVGACVVVTGGMGSEPSGQYGRAGCYGGVLLPKTSRSRRSSPFPVLLVPL